MVKRFLFKWYWVIAIISVISCIIAAVTTTLGSKECITTIALIVTSVFFIQKQKLNELNLFWELFKTFNERYDELNEKMNRIFSSEKEFSDNEIDTLFKRGYILPEVWQAWKNGMLHFASDKRIKSLWDKELDSNSYYGFSLED